MLFKFKEGDNFNRRNTLSILRIKLKLHCVQNVEPNTEIGQKRVFCKGLKVKGPLFTHLDLYQWSGADPFIVFFLELLEPISKIRLVFRARRETVKKRSIHLVCEHFEPFRNTAMGT